MRRVLEGNHLIEMKKTMVGEAIITIDREDIEEGIEVGIGADTVAGIEVETIGSIIRRNRTTRTPTTNSPTNQTKAPTNQTSKKNPNSTKTRTAAPRAATTATVTTITITSIVAIEGDTNNNHRWWRR